MLAKCFRKYSLFIAVLLALISNRGESIAQAQESAAEFSGENAFADVHFIDFRRGWVVGGNGLVFSTQDGGKTWRRKQLGNSNLKRVSFLDDRRGWILSASTLFVTSDGGRSWLRRALPGRAEAFRFVTPEVGWLVGKKGEIAKTTDGGRHWKEQHADTYFDLNDIGCFTVDNCIIVGNRGIIRLTTDSGKTWARIKSPFWDEDISSLFIAADGTSWALHWETQTVMLYRSNDKGRTWDIANRNLPSFAQSLFFWDKNTGVIVGSGIDRTTNGGSSWLSAKAPTSVQLNGVFFINDKLGWAVGDFKTILHTEDGGKTWIKQYSEYPLR